MCCSEWSEYQPATYWSLSGGKRLGATAISVGSARVCNCLEVIQIFFPIIPFAVFVSFLCLSPWVTSQLSFLLCVECNHLAKEQTLKNSWSSQGMYFDPSSTAQDKQWNWCQFRFFPLLLWDWNTWIAMSSELYNFWYLPRYCVYVKKPLTESSFSVVSQDTICKCCSFREKWTYSSKCSHLWSTICFGYGHQHFTILWVHRVSIWTGTWSVQPVITEDEKHVSWVAVAEWCMLDWTHTKSF